MSVAHVLYYYLLLFRLAINKEVLASELLTTYINYSDMLYFLFLLKLNEDSVLEKYGEFVIVKNDNLIIWAEALMDATVMHNMVQSTQTNLADTIVIGKLQKVIERLIREQEILVSAKYLVHNL